MTHEVSFSLPEAFSNPDCLIMHRGMKNNGYPEFSEKSFQKCREIGVAAEVDIRRCRDGVVVIHDSNTAKVAKAALKVRDLSVRQFEKLRFKGTKAAGLMSLPTLLDRVKDIGLLLDLKDPYIEEMVIQALQNSWDGLDRVMLICRSEKALTNAHEIGPAYHRCFAIKTKQQLAEAITKIDFLAEYASALSIQHTLLDNAALVGQIQRSGLAVIAWCINNEEQFKWCRKLGIIPVADFLPLVISKPSNLDDYREQLAVNY
jgi:glycerophosphoryl diester phosphodiesterase